MANVEALVRGAVERFRVAGSDTPRLDAEVLLANVLNIDRTGVVAHPEAVVSDDAAARFEQAVIRREAGEPVAYVRGIKEFMGLAFAADPRALIPRPETEQVVELAEAEVVRRLAGAPRGEGAPRLRIVDVGTGSGAIAVALAVRLRARRMDTEVDILAADDDPAALDLARENAVGHAVGDVIRFAVAPLIPGDERAFDLVLANLPYIPSGDIAGLPIAASFEPRHALDGGSDGLAVIRDLIALLPDVLARHGTAFLEIGAGQAAGVAAAVDELPRGWSSSVAPDLGGSPRVARIERVEPVEPVERHS